MVRGQPIGRRKILVSKNTRLLPLNMRLSVGTKTYRYVITREKKADTQGNLFTGDNFTYRAIMTNNREMTDVAVVEFYNNRAKVNACLMK